MAGTQRRPIAAHPVDAVVKELLGITPEKTAIKEQAFLAARTAEVTVVTETITPTGPYTAVKGTTRRKLVIPVDPVIQAVETAESNGQDGYLAGIMAKTETPEKTLEELTDIVTDAIGADILESRKLGPAGEDYLIRQGWTPEMVAEMQKGVDAGGLDSPFENPLPIGEAIPDDPNLDATDGAHPAWWRGYGYLDAETERMFGMGLSEVKRIWDMIHKPGVLTALKFALDTYRHPPTVKIEGHTEFVDLRDEIRTTMLSAVDDIAKKVGEQLLGADEVEELVVTDEDIPELQEKIDEAKDAAIKVLRTEVAELRNEVSKVIDKAESNFKDDEKIAELGDEARHLDPLEATREADAVILHLRKHFGELG